ncbi:uncharacterized protein [Oscarella lobularis]|uniref:uncharacterized protein isoform X2 n=1 Tax=Oscarella lobularis TaxID=121494 RepID=UPI003313DC02
MGRGKRLASRRKQGLSGRNRRKRRAKQSEDPRTRPVHAEVDAVAPVDVSVEESASTTESDEEPTVYQRLLDSLTVQPALETTKDKTLSTSSEEYEGEEVELNDEKKSDGDSEPEEVAEDETSRETDGLPASDPFCRHFEVNLSDEDVEKLRNKGSRSTSQNSDPMLGLISSASPLEQQIIDQKSSKSTIDTIRTRLVNHWKTVNDPEAKDKETKHAFFTPLQESLFSHISNYRDLLYVQRDFENGEEIRPLYCLHALNHVLKSRHRVTKNNSRLRQAFESGADASECLDQGMTRPKVLILVPFRNSALRVVETMTKLLMTEEKASKCLLSSATSSDSKLRSQMTVGNKKRFRDENSAVDKNFVQLLHSIFGKGVIEKYEVEYPGDWVDLISMKFETNKRTSSPNNATYVEFPFSFHSFLTDRKTSVKGAIAATGNSNLKCVRGALAMKYREVCKLFQPVFVNIAEHLETIIRNVGRVEYMILVGGFATCELLQNYLRDRFEKSFSLRIIIPPESSLAVVMGAVLFGHDPTEVVSRRVRYTYSMECRPEFVEGLDPVSYCIVDDTGTERCLHRLQIFVQRNDELEVGQEVMHVFYPPSANTTKVDICIYSSEILLPRYSTDEGVKQVARMTLPMPNTKGGKNRRLHVAMRFGKTEIEVVSTDVSSNTEVRGTVKLDFLGHSE